MKECISMYPGEETPYESGMSQSVLFVGGVTKRRQLIAALSLQSRDHPAGSFLQNPALSSVASTELNKILSATLSFSQLLLRSF